MLDGYARVLPSHPVAPASHLLVRQREGGVVGAISRRGPPQVTLRQVVAVEKDVSHRPLQPTFNTSTRIAVGVPLRRPPSPPPCGGREGCQGLVGRKGSGAHAPRPRPTTGGTSLDGEGPALATLHPLRCDSRQSGKQGAEVSLCTRGGALIRG